jgi:hypothetical protein
MIAAHFLVFLLAAYQHRIHVALGDTPPSRYRPVPISASMKDAWRPITYDSVNQWTWLDFVRFWFYRCDTHFVPSNLPFLCLLQAYWRGNYCASLSVDMVINQELKNGRLVKRSNSSVKYLLGRMWRHLESFERQTPLSAA